MIQIMKCCVCGKMSKANLLILGKNICLRCEDKIVQMEAGDKNYKYYKNGLKKLFISSEKNLNERSPFILY